LFFLFLNSGLSSVLPFSSASLGAIDFYSTFSYSSNPNIYLPSIVNRNAIGTQSPTAQKPFNFLDSKLTKALARNAQ
jgi:hypothetical protein